MSFMGNMIGNKALAAHGKNEYEKALQLYNEACEKGWTSRGCCADTAFC